VKIMDDKDLAIAVTENKGVRKFIENMLIEDRELN
jgi:hypothetical protein